MGLEKEGFPELSRRSCVKIGLTVKEVKTPKRSERVSVAQMDGQHLPCESAGVFLFAPFLKSFNIPKLVRAAELPGSKVIPPVGCLMSFLTITHWDGAVRPYGKTCFRSRPGIVRGSKPLIQIYSHVHIFLFSFSLLEALRPKIMTVTQEGIPNQGKA
jgi:hypothetical protein